MGNRNSRIDFIYDNLEHARKEKGIKKKAIWELVDRTESTYKSWSQQKRIEKEHLEKIADYLGVDFVWLLTGLLREKTKEAPTDRDYIRDQDGYIVPAYNGTKFLDLAKENAIRLELFLEWSHQNKSSFFDFVNKQLLEDGESPIQRKAFNKYMDTFEMTLEPEVFAFCVKKLSEDIKSMRNRFAERGIDYDSYLNSKK